MPAVIPYTAHLFIIYKREERDGEVFFSPFNSASQSSPPEYYSALTTQLDAFRIRDAFLTVTTPDDALSFLRDTGQFLPTQGPISWSEFQKWQGLAEAMHMEDSREALLSRNLPHPLPLPLKGKPDLVQLHRLVQRDPKHQYFGPAKEKALPDWVEQDLRDLPDVTSQNEEVRELIRNQRREAFLDGVRRTSRDRHDLELRFVDPPPETYKIAWAASVPHPWLVFAVNTTLEAVAAAVYVDRVAGQKFRKCKLTTCGKIFKVGSHDDQKVCPGQQDAYKKQEKRKRNGDKNGKGSK